MEWVEEMRSSDLAKVTQGHFIWAVSDLHLDHDDAFGLQTEKEENKDKRRASFVYDLF